MRRLDFSVVTLGPKTRLYVFGLVVQQPVLRAGSQTQPWCAEWQLVWVRWEQLW